MSKDTQSSLHPDKHLIVLYDGTCVLCNWYVRFLLRRDHAGVFRFAPLESAAGRELGAAAPEGVDTVVLRDGERLLVRSEAFFRIVGVLGIPWSWIAVLRYLPRPLTDAVYNVIARTRHALFGTYEKCPVPDGEMRERFLERAFEKEG